MKQICFQCSVILIRAFRCLYVNCWNLLLEQSQRFLFSHGMTSVYKMKCLCYHVGLQWSVRVHDLNEHWNNSIIKIVVFWTVTSYCLVVVYQRFRGTCYLHHQGDSSQPRSHLASHSQLMEPLHRKCDTGSAVLTTYSRHIFGCRHIVRLK
jgi:hypothetical protein